MEPLDGFQATDVCTPGGWTYKGLAFPPSQEVAPKVGPGPHNPFSSNKQATPSCVTVTLLYSHTSTTLCFKVGMP